MLWGTTKSLFFVCLKSSEISAIVSWVEASTQYLFCFVFQIIDRMVLNKSHDSLDFDVLELAIKY